MYCYLTGLYQLSKCKYHNNLYEIDILIVSYSAIYVCIYIYIFFNIKSVVNISRYIPIKLTPFFFFFGGKGEASWISCSL